MGLYASLGRRLVMIGEPFHSILCIGHARPRGDVRARYHHDWKPEYSRRLDLRDGRLPARVLSKNDRDAMIAKQPDIALCAKGPARLNNPGMRQIERLSRQIDEPDDVTMLRRLPQIRESETADAAEDGTWSGSEGFNRASDIGDLDPAVLRLLLPSGPLKGEQRHAGHARSLNRVPAHPGCERVRSVDQTIDPPGLEIAGQSLGTPKSADPNLDRLGERGGGAAGKRQNGVKPCVRRKQSRKGACLGRTAQKEDAHGPRV